MQRSKADKLAIFKTCFTGITHAYGTYDPTTGRIAAIRRPVTDDVFLRHLRGVQPYGVYLLVNDRARAVTADFDDDDAMPVLAFVDQAVAYGLRPYVERSKCKGWHVCCFFPPGGVLAFKVRLVLKAVLDDIGAPRTEVFPKQDRVGQRQQLGNFINAPLWGRMVPHGRTVFVNPRGQLRPYDDQWALLADVDRVTEHQLGEIIEINDLHPTTAAPAIAQNACDTTRVPKS